MAKGKDECSGRVEVRHAETWQTVCDAGWTESKAEVVCQLLECGHTLNAPGGASFGQGNGTVVEASDSCFSNMTSLQKCSVNGFRRSTCGHEHDAGAVCAGTFFIDSIMFYYIFHPKIPSRRPFAGYSSPEQLKQVFVFFCICLIIVL